MIYDAGDKVYASSVKEAMEVARERGGKIRTNTDFSVLDLLENYWFPQDWPWEPEEDIIWIIE